MNSNILFTRRFSIKESQYLTTKDKIEYLYMELDRTYKVLMHMGFNPAQMEIRLPTFLGSFFNNNIGVLPSYGLEQKPAEIYHGTLNQKWRLYEAPNQKVNHIYMNDDIETV